MIGGLEGETRSKHHQHPQLWIFLQYDIERTSQRDVQLHTKAKTRRTGPAKL